MLFNRIIKYEDDDECMEDSSEAQEKVENEVEDYSGNISDRDLDEMNLKTQPMDSIPLKSYHPSQTLDDHMTRKSNDNFYKTSFVRQTQKNSCFNKFAVKDSQNRLSI